MKGTKLRLVFAAIALLAAAPAAFALEFGLDAETTNLQIPWDQQAPIGDATFPVSNYFWGGEAWLKAPLGDEASVRVSYDRDPVLRNTAIAAVLFERGIARISVGPLFGFLNSDSSEFSAGISASVRLQWPGVAYVSLRSDGGTAISILQSSTDPQAQTEISAGVYVPNAIISGVLQAKRFNELDGDGLLISDNFTRYAMTIDVFKKNVPYNALLSIGYELRSKHYAASDTTDSLGAVVLGLDTAIQIDRAFAVKAGFSTGAYVFGLDALKGRGPGSNAFLFSANLGMSLDTSEIVARVSVPAETPSAEETPATEATSASAEPAAGAEAAPEKPKPEFSRLALDAGAGLNYNDRIQLSGVLAIFGAVLNSRAGVWASAGYRFTPGLMLGGEVGFDYITLSTSGIDYTFFDIPIRAKIGYSLGKVIGFEGFGGAYINGVAGSGITTDTTVDIDVGGRIKLAGLYAEASYVIGVGSKGQDLGSFGAIMTSYARFGLGYDLKIK